ncbi:MAG TPA: efflux transporter outer membrane subunit [Stellaceae bacterium]|nr:efflux transporter outer membrane subunit [Stellaceae bacterium]
MRVLLAVAALGALAACTVGPDYERPSAPQPAAGAYKEIAGFKPAAPSAPQSGAPWWSIYDDPLLASLEGEVVVSNETLKADEAAFRVASAIVDEARAGYYPTVTASASAARTAAAFQGGSVTRGGGRGGSSTIYQNSFSIGPAATWVPDIWGKIRRSVESDVANAQASAADLAAAQLSEQGTLATDYFELRIADEQKRVLEQTIAADQRSLEIARNQFNAGFVAQTDVATAETQLETAHAQLIGLDVQRATLEHAVAVLIGKPPADFSIARVSYPTTVPVVPAGVPSTLLERRPDIAAAERAMASENALIGVAISAYYPDITLSADATFASSMIQNVLSLANAGWTAAAAASGTVFDGGLRSAQVAAARASYDEAVASYRNTVLAAFQQVEDDLASLRILQQQYAAQEIAVRSSEQAVTLTVNQYQAGTVAYTAVVVAQTTALGDEQQLLNILQSRLVASANLIEALGGGWDAKQLPAL